AIPTDRENELLTLIHDLNKCNDALLARVSQLETALNDSHQVLHNETEKAKAAQSKMVEQVSMQQASTQQLSQTAQQQIAKLVDQLETAEQAFERQQLINETLLSELGNAQERVAQLEHESALSAQQHAEEIQASVQAETTIKDLRSRLQRQQRYTLQFKAALEKSLTVTTTRSIESRAPQPILPSMTQPIWDQSASHSNSVSMPKAQRIMPWAGAITTPFEGIDPHLENLIRGANQSSLEPNASFESTKVKASDVDASNIRASEIGEPEIEGPEIETPDLRTLDNTSSIGDTEAKSQLWQDLERVIDERVTDEPVSASFVNNDAANTSLHPIESPKFNWQQSGSNQSAEVPSPTLRPTSAAEILTATPAALTDQTQAEPAEALVEKKVSDLPSIVIDPYTVPTGQAPAAAVDLTEPSPWGTAASAEKTRGQAVAQGVGTTDQQGSSHEVLAHEDSSSSENSSVAPVVNALRRQKRVNSLSSVQLPTFEKAKAGSFRR
ncbi:MAG: hypothetical protein WA901_05855, partial [Phormidesmis sp.]